MSAIDEFAANSNNKAQKAAEAEEGSKLPEAPASGSVKIKSPNGFEWIYTMRSEKMSTLYYKSKAMEKIWMTDGYIPLAQNNGYQKKTEPAAEVETKPCPMHEGAVMKDPKGKGFYHSRGTYPNMDFCNGEGYRTNKAGV